MKISCIYCIFNIVNNKIYIGLCKDLIDRKRRHLQDFRGKRHYNRHLQSAWNKYGEESFRFIIIEECEIEELENNEMFYIKLFGAKNKDLGYNLTDGGGTTIGYKFTDKQKDNMSMAQHRRKIHKYSLEGEYIESFNSIKEANKITGCHEGDMIKSARNNTKKSSGGFRWSYRKVDRLKSKFNSWGRNPLKEKYFQYDLDGNLIKSYKTMKELENAGFDSVKVFLVARGDRNKHKGYKWKMSQLGIRNE